MPASNYFVVKLSPELRVHIYIYVFGTSKHVKRLYQDELPPNAKQDKRLVLTQPREKPMPTVVPIDILATNRLINNEATETLYKTRIVHLTVPQMINDLRKAAGYLELVRDVEFEDCFNHVLFNDINLLHDAARAALQLPLVRTVKILSDGFAYNPSHPGYNNSDIVHKCFLRVNEFAHSFLQSDVKCVDIGEFVVQSGRFEGVQIVNSKLLRMWPHVQSTPDDYDGYLAAQEVIRDWHLSGFPSNLYAFSAQTSLRIWVGLYDQGREWVNRKPRPPEPGQIIDVEWFDRLMASKFMRHRSDIPIWAGSGGSQDFRLCRLGGNDDPVLLEWASEFLAMNIETFVYKQDGSDVFGGEIVDAKSYWSELEGGGGIGESMARMQEMNHTAFRDNFLVPVPCHKRLWWDLDMIRERLLDDEHRLIFGKDHIEAAGKGDLQKMFYLMMALGLWRVTDDAEEPEDEEMKAWSTALLHKYVLASRAAEDEEAMPDLDLMRHAFLSLTAMVITQDGTETWVEDALGTGNNLLQRSAMEIDDGVVEDEDVHRPTVAKLGKLFCANLKRHYMLASDDQ